MPKEETIEMRRVRNVQGELTDLPEDNPRATLSSRIRALLLRETGLPQLIHLYGTLALNKTFTANTGENACYDILTDGRYLYIGTANATTNPTLIKVDLDTFTELDSLVLSTANTHTGGLASDGESLYVGIQGSPGSIAKVNLNSFTVTDTLELDITEDNVDALFIDGSSLYAGLYIAPAKIVKIDLNTFTKDTTLTLPGGENNCRDLSSDGTSLYCTLWTSPGKITKVDLGTFTRDSTVTFDVGDNSGYSAFINGNYLYGSTYTSPAKIYKIALYPFEIFDVLTLAAGEDNCRSISGDGNHLYAGLFTSPAKIVKIDFLNFREVHTETFGAGENECLSLLVDGTYVYAGLFTSPAKVIRQYIIPVGASLQERSIREVYTRTVEQSMPMLFYGKVTTYTDTTHFKVSKLDGFGDDFFANNKWYVFVARDAGGASAAPDGELQPISDYTSSDATFEHIAFTVPLALNDEVLILHKSIASTISSSTTVDNISNLVNAILVTTETGGEVSTNGAAEVNVYINNAPAGVYKPLIVKIWFTNQTAAETVIVREKYRIEATGGFIEDDAVTFAGVQDPLLKVIHLDPTRFGVQLTIAKNAGADRAYRWEAVYDI